MFGVAFGLGADIFLYAKGYSYLTNNPAACANCHVMQAHYDAWMKSSIIPWRAATTATLRTT